MKYRDGPHPEVRILLGPYYPLELCLRHTREPTVPSTLTSVRLSFELALSSLTSVRVLLELALLDLMSVRVSLEFALLDLTSIRVLLELALLAWTSPFAQKKHCCACSSLVSPHLTQSFA